jgi:hypothetical protein
MAEAPAAAAAPAIKVTRHDGAVRLTMPARVANDLNALQRGLRNLAERLDHPKCATGCDILQLMLEREFSLTEKVELNPQPLPPKAGPLPDPWLSAASNTVLVSIPARVNNDIDLLGKTIATVVGKLGCQACCSGFDILFQEELGILGVDERLNVTGFGRFR